jgi:uncharacterized protein YkwD
MITNKILALILSLFTVGGVAAGTVTNNNGQVVKFPIDSIIQKLKIANPNNGQVIQLPTGESVNVQKPVTEVPKTESPKTEAPKVETPKTEAPKVEVPVKEVPKTETPKVEQPATKPSTTVPSGVPANPSNKSFKYLDAVEKEILTYVNQARSQQGLKPLSWEENMRPIARYKSNNMLQYNYFEHNTPSLNNASPMDLATKYFKYNTNGYGENIFYSMGYAEATTTAKYLVDQWMNSPGHRANILNANWTKMSAGVVFSSQGNYVYATQHFSRN